MSLSDNIRHAKELARDQAVVSSATTATRSLPCVHLGPPTGGTTPCTTCRGTVVNKRFACAVHGSCVVADCRTCPTYQTPVVTPFLPITHRTLLYHIYPLENGVGAWRRNVELLRPHLPAFDRVVVAVARDGVSRTRVRTDPAVREPDRVLGPTAPFTDVVAAFGEDHRERMEFLPVENHPDLWEAAHHRELFARAESTDSGAVVLYAQAKGVTRPVHHIAHRWTAALYDLMLGYRHQAEELLRTYPVVGCFKKLGRGFAESRSSWHYSGSWFWVRARELYTRDWTCIDPFWAGIEAYPSLHFTHKEAGCLFHEAPVRSMNLYSPTYWGSVVGPKLAAWKATYARPTVSSKVPVSTTWPDRPAGPPPPSTGVGPSPLPRSPRTGPDSSLPT